MKMEKTSAALPHRRECVRMSVAFLVAVAQSSVLLVNKIVLATQILVFSSRARDAVHKCCILYKQHVAPTAAKKIARTAANTKKLQPFLIGEKLVNKA